MIYTYSPLKQKTNEHPSPSAEARHVAPHVTGRLGDAVRVHRGRVHGAQLVGHISADATGRWPGLVSVESYG